MRAVGRSTGTNGRTERYQLPAVHGFTLIGGKRSGRRCREAVVADLGRPGLADAQPGEGFETWFNSSETTVRFLIAIDLSTTLREACTALYSLSTGDPHLGASLYAEFGRRVKMSEKGEST